MNNNESKLSRDITITITINISPRVKYSKSKVKSPLFYIILLIITINNHNKDQNKIFTNQTVKLYSIKPTKPKQISQIPLAHCSQIEKKKPQRRENYK